MGFVHRLTSACVAVACFVACGGSEPDEVLRQELLKPKELGALQAARREQKRILDDQGNLLPSTERRAGFLVPRGYKEAYAFESEWYFDGRVPLPVLERYVRSQIEVGTVETHIGGKVDFIGSLPKGVANPTPTFISVFPHSGHRDKTRLHIHGYVEPRDGPQDPDVVQAQINASRKRAD
jgi:hypothetical protein